MTQAGFSGESARTLTMNESNYRIDGGRVKRRALSSARQVQHLKHNVRQRENGIYDFITTQ